MKRIATIIILLYAMATYSQSDSLTVVTLAEYEYIHNDSIKTFSYSRELKKQLDDFFAYAYMNKVDLSRLDDFEGIYYLKIEDHYSDQKRALGLTLLDIATKDVILINKTRVPDYLPTLINIVIYHEFYHLLVNYPGHCNVGNCPIVTMAGSLTIPIMEDIMKIWDHELRNEYFEHINFQLNYQKMVLEKSKE